MMSKDVIVAALDEEIRRLEEARDVMLSLEPDAVVRSPRSSNGHAARQTHVSSNGHAARGNHISSNGRASGKKRTLSADARRRIGEATRRRWKIAKRNGHSVPTMRSAA